MTWDYRGNKYRGKAIENIEGVCKHGDWVYGAYVEGARLDKIPYIIGNIEEATDDYVIPYFWARVDKETIGQGINREDKKGNDIFEGDIVLCFRMEGAEEIIGVVKYNAIHCCFEVCGRKVNGDKNRIVLTMRQCWNVNCIGNIYDNSELLEVS